VTHVCCVVLCCVVLCVLAGVRVAHGVHEDAAAVTGERLVPLRHYYTTPLLHCVTTPLRCYSTASLLHYSTVLLLHCVTTPLRYYSTASFHYCHIPLLHNCMTTLHYYTLRYSICLVLSSHLMSLTHSSTLSHV
jgi:hypothetical protein